MARLRFFSLTVLLLIIDRLTKVWVHAHLRFAEPHTVINHLFYLIRVHNEGGAFGVFPGGGLVFLIVSSIVSFILFVILLAIHIESKLIRTGMAFVLAGALGNLIDRIQWGYVLDFFQIRGFAIINVADACITVGAGLIILSILLGGERHRSRRKADRVRGN